MTADRAAKTFLNDQFSRIGKALASPRRIELLDLLAQGERSVESIASETQMSVALASAHLKALRGARLVEPRRDGTRIFYRLAGDDVYRLLAAVRDVARTRLADGEQAVTAYLSGPDDLEPVSREELAVRVRAPRRILVTGGTGTLGRHVVAYLARQPEIICRALSRRPRPAEFDPLVEWASVDLRGDPLAQSVEGVDAVIHLASGKGGGDDDVTATGRLLEAAKAGGVRHVVVISIIGCDRIPLPFYASKLRIEALAEAVGVPWSIVRVAQFHSFVARLISTPAALPVPSPIVVDLRFQPIDEAEAAAYLVDVALGPPLGRTPELAGPETLTLGRIAALWFAAAGRPSTLLPVPLAVIARAPAAELSNPAWTLDVLSGYEAGWNTPQGDRRLGSVTFAEWLQRAAELDPEPRGI